MPKKQKQIQPETGPFAFEDTAFLMRDEMRGHRLTLEYERAELGLKDQRVRSTVVVFGSARAKPPSKEKHASIEPGTNLDVAPSDVGTWYREARKFARIVSERGGALSPVGGFRDNVIATGGGPGIMEAANRGAHDAGAPSIGFNIWLPLEQHPNKYITPELNFHFHYFAIRKMHFAMRANALAVFPGGFGTLDELFEILTLKQTRKTRGMPVVLFCRHYWETVVNLEALERFGTIGPDDQDLFEVVDSAEEGWDRLLERGLTIATPLRED